MSDWETDEHEADVHGMFWHGGEASDDDEDIDESWYDEDTGRIKPGIHMPEKWRFLWKWFYVLKYKVSVSQPSYNDTDHVRLGRDPGDWRIEINFLEEMRRENATLEAALKRIRTIREAVLITTLLAEVDYDTWLSELQFTSLYAPVEFVDLKAHRLQRKYSVLYYGEYPAEWYAWTRLQHFFGVDNFSDGFTRDLKKLADLAAADGVDVYALRSVPVEIHCMTQHGETWRPRQRQVMYNLLETTTKIREIERERCTKRRSKRLHGTPVFSIEEGVILNFRSFEIRSRTLDAIRRLVDSGVRVKWLVLPAVWMGGESDSDDEDEYGGSDAGHGSDNDPDDLVYDDIDCWVPLAQSLTGNGPYGTRVSGVVLSMWYCREPLLTAFCSGLATAKELKFLRLEAYVEDGFFTERVSWRTWAWLGYALLNKASTSSVETLSLVGFELDDEKLDALEEAKLAKDPLAYLWRELTNPDEGFVCNGPSNRPVVSIRTTANLDLYDTNSLENEFIEAPMFTTAIAMDDGTPVDVLLPGFGFCRVDRENITHKRQRLAPVKSTTHPKCSSMKTLLLDFSTRHHDDDPLDADSYLPRLLEIVGESLTSLSIIAKDVKDESLLNGLANCRRLENLSLGGMELKSMVPVMELYYIGVQLSSIELHDLTVPVDKFDSFIKQLDEDAFLRRLRIGECFGHRLKSSTAEAMQYVLESNTQLDYVHLYYSDYFEGRPSNPLRKWNCDKFNKQPLPIPLPGQSRLAFLSVLRRDASNVDARPRTRLSEDTIEKIFEFAGSTSRRLVIEKRDSWFRANRYA